MEYFDSEKLDKLEREIVVKNKITHLNELIRRGDALKAFDDNITWGAPRIAIMNVPPVNQPMSAVDYVRALRKLVKWCEGRKCFSCEYHNKCSRMRVETVEYQVSFVEKWAKDQGVN